MTPLRQRMLEDMQLRGLSARTQECYVAAVRQFAEHSHTRPDHLTEEPLRQYFLSLANDTKVARATATIALCGLRFFYEQTRTQPWTTVRFVRPRREKKLPVVLIREEVRRILHAVRSPIYRACLTTIYAGGLRWLEGARLQVTQARVATAWRSNCSAVAGGGVRTGAEADADADAGVEARAETGSAMRPRRRDPMVRRRSAPAAPAGWRARQPRESTRRPAYRGRTRHCAGRRSRGRQYWRASGRGGHGPEC